MAPEASDGREPRFDSVAIDVGTLVKTVASLYSHLVTRPTGRAVRLAIESQLAEVVGPAVSLIDLSHVAVLDFSCADEVVAKLLERYLEGDRPGDAFFILRGLADSHRDPVEAVLRRRSLAVVAQRGRRSFELLGEASAEEGRVWRALEERGRLPLLVRDGPGLEDSPSSSTLERLVSRRLAYRREASGEVVALSRLVHSEGAQAP